MVKIIITMQIARRNGAIYKRKNTGEQSVKVWAE